MVAWETNIHLHFKKDVAWQHVHAYPNHEHGIVLAMPGVVAL